MQKLLFCFLTLIAAASVFAANFKYNRELSSSASLTFPFTFEKNDWNDNSKTIRTSGAGGEVQGRFKPYGLPFGFFAQFGFSQPRNITEKRSGKTLSSESSDYSKIWSTDFQAGTYFLAYESKNWYVPYGFGLHYKLNYNKVTNIETSSNMFGLGAFIHGEYRLSDSIWYFAGLNVCYDFAGGEKRGCTSGGTTTTYYSDSGFMQNFELTPKIGFIIFSR